jgi:prepilin-type processing-associated H-X9-DG protein
MYVGDHGCYPGYYGFISWIGDAGMWPEALEPYTGAKWLEGNRDPNHPELSRGSGIYACPGYNRIPGVYERPRVPAGRHGSYGYNVHGVQNKDWSRFEPTLGLGGLRKVTEAIDDHSMPVRENQVSNPSDMIAVGDSVIEIRNDQTSDYFVGTADLSRGIKSGVFNGAPTLDALKVKLAMKRRHAARWNVVFCDAHVESLRIEELFDNRKISVLQRWNRDNNPHPELLTP